MASTSRNAGRVRLAVLVPALAALPLALLAGCKDAAKSGAQQEAPTVPVAKPVERNVTEYVDFTGRTDAVEAVDIRARVTGFLVQAPFKEGSTVKKGELLFEIDPRPYQAQLDQAVAQVKLNEASLELAKSTLRRAEATNEKTPGAVSIQEVEQDIAAVKEAVARLDASKASTEVYKLNLNFCQVTSPIDGQVSRYYYTPGNLISQDQTLLTTVVSVDPMFVYFDMDEPTLLRIRTAIRTGEIKVPEPRWYRPISFPVYMGLQGESGYPHRGDIDFVNNQVNPATGSISVRGIFPNPKPPVGQRLLSPGMFVRIHLPIGEPRASLLVIDRAIQSDQGLKYVYVLDADNKVQQRRVSTGQLESDGLRVIRTGLQPDDRVVVGALQSVRPRQQIKPEPVAMPTLGPGSGTEGAR